MNDWVPHRVTSLVSNLHVLQPPTGRRSPHGVCSRRVLCGPTISRFLDRRFGREIRVLFYIQILLS
jgi:hypothetical protein